jgi:hypothetical protein
MTYDMGVTTNKKGGGPGELWFTDTPTWSPKDFDTHRQRVP